MDSGVNQPSFGDSFSLNKNGSGRGDSTGKSRGRDSSSSEKSLIKTSKRNRKHSIANVMRDASKLLATNLCQGEENGVGNAMSVTLSEPCPRKSPAQVSRARDEEMRREVV